MSRTYVYLVRAQSRLGGLTWGGWEEEREATGDEVAEQDGE